MRGQCMGASSVVFAGATDPATLEALACQKAWPYHTGRSDDVPRASLSTRLVCL